MKEGGDFTPPSLQLVKKVQIVLFYKLEIFRFPFSVIYFVCKGQALSE